MHSGPDSAAQSNYMFTFSSKTEFIVLMGLNSKLLHYFDKLGKQLSLSYSKYTRASVCEFECARVRTRVYLNIFAYISLAKPGRRRSSPLSARFPPNPPLDAPRVHSAAAIAFKCTWMDTHLRTAPCLTPPSLSLPRRSRPPFDRCSCNCVGGGGATEDGTRPCRFRVEQMPLALC